MILGTGIDIIEIERIEKVVKKRKKFLDKIFTLKENQYFNANGKIRAESVAGYFAAKEAVSKSMGTGFSGLRWQDIEIQKSPLGQPQVVLWGKAKLEAKRLGIESIILSISHCRRYAIAQVIAMGKDIIGGDE